MNRKIRKQWVTYMKAFVVIFALILTGSISIKYHPVQAFNFEGNVV